MAEEKIVKINLRKELLKVPRWRRRDRYFSILKKKLKNKDLVISQKANENIWSGKSPKIKLKIVKEDKSVKADIVE